MEWDVVFVSNCQQVTRSGYASKLLRYHAAAVMCQTVRVGHSECGSPQLSRMTHRKKGKEKKEEAGWETATVLAVCAQFESDVPAEQSHLKDLKHLFFGGFLPLIHSFGQQEEFTRCHLWPSIQRKCTLCVFSFFYKLWQVVTGGGSNVRRCAAHFGCNTLQAVSSVGK